MSLFARVGRPESRRGRASASDVRASVLGHLQQMCRTRQGSVPAAFDYGLPDLTDMTRSPSETAALVARALKYTIDTYEPRLRGVRVEYVPGESWDQLLRFQITAQLITGVGKDRTHVQFATRIDPSRRVIVD